MSDAYLKVRGMKGEKSCVSYSDRGEMKVLTGVVGDGTST